MRPPNELSPEMKRPTNDASLRDQGIGHLVESFPERTRILDRANGRPISRCFQRTAPQSRRTQGRRSQTQTVGAAGRRPGLRIDPLMERNSKGIALQLPGKCDLSVRCRWRALFGIGADAEREDAALQF